MSYNGHPVITGVPKEYQVRFYKARAKLQAAGCKVRRCSYDYGQYYVTQGDKEWFCSIWDVINMAENLR